MKILGIDPGYERLGIAILEKGSNDKRERVLHSECFKTPAKMEFSERLLLVGEKIKNIIKTHGPEMLAIETLFLSTNQKTAMRVAEARGVVIYEAKSSGVDIFEASPLEIKMAITGYGKSDKEQVMKMIKMLVQVDKSKKSDDELDAIGIALTGFAMIKKYKSS